MIKRLRFVRYKVPLVSTVRAIKCGLAILSTTDVTDGQGVTDKDVLSFARERQVPK